MDGNKAFYHDMNQPHGIDCGSKSSDDSYQSSVSLHEGNPADMSSDESLKITKLEKVSFGVIINSNVYLPSNQWNTLTNIDDINKTHCFVCNQLFTMSSRNEHMESGHHKVQLTMIRPLKQYDLSIIRKIQKTFHCGVCNEVFSEAKERQHVDSKAHENNILFAINKASDIIFDYRLEENDVIRQPMEDTSASENEDSDSDTVNYDSDSDCSNDDNEENCDLNLPSISYASMARRNIDVPSKLKIDLGDKLVWVKYESWHMIISISSGRFYCMACKFLNAKRLKFDHCKTAEHVENLKKCKIVETYAWHLIRSIDGKFFHCAHCNNIRMSNEIYDHIQQFHGNFMKSIENKTDVAITKQRTTSESDRAKKSVTITNLMNKMEITNDDMMLQVQNMLPRPVRACASTQTDKVPDLKVTDVIHVHLFGHKLQLPLVNLNTVVKRTTTYFCLLCDLTVVEAFLMKHMLDMHHIDIMFRMPFIAEFGHSLVRGIKNSLHCAICNTLIPNERAKVLLHISTIEHNVCLRRALGIADKDVQHFETEGQTKVKLSPKKQQRLEDEKPNIKQLDEKLNETPNINTVEITLYKNENMTDKNPIKDKKSTEENEISILPIKDNKPISPTKYEIRNKIHIPQTKIEQSCTESNDLNVEIEGEKVLRALQMSPTQCDMLMSIWNFSTSDNKQKLERQNKMTHEGEIASVLQKQRNIMTQQDHETHETQSKKSQYKMKLGYITEQLNELLMCQNQVGSNERQKLPDQNSLKGQGQMTTKQNPMLPTQNQMGSNDGKTLPNPNNIMTKGQIQNQMLPTQDQIRYNDKQILPNPNCMVTQGQITTQQNQMLPTLDPLASNDRVVLPNQNNMMTQGHNITQQNQMLLMQDQKGSNHRQMVPNQNNMRTQGLMTQQIHMLSTEDQTESNDGQKLPNYNYMMPQSYMTTPQSEILTQMGSNASQMSNNMISHMTTVQGQMLTNESQFGSIGRQMIINPSNMMNQNHWNAQKNQMLATQGVVVSNVNHMLPNQTTTLQDQVGNTMLSNNNFFVPAQNKITPSQYHMLRYQSNIYSKQHCTTTQDPIAQSGMDSQNHNMPNYMNMLPQGAMLQNQGSLIKPHCNMIPNQMMTARSLESHLQANRGNAMTPNQLPPNWIQNMQNNVIPNPIQTNQIQDFDRIMFQNDNLMSSNQIGTVPNDNQFLSLSQSDIKVENNYISNQNKTIPNDNTISLDQIQNLPNVNRMPLKQSDNINDIIASEIMPDEKIAIDHMLPNTNSLQNQNSSNNDNFNNKQKYEIPISKNNDNFTDTHKPAVDKETAIITEAVDLNSHDDPYITSDYIVVKLKNTQFKIHFESWHSLVYAGDGHVFCFMCALKICCGEIKKHIASKDHLRKVKEHVVLEGFGDNLLRQVDNIYHCAICNVVVSESSLQRHLCWPQHVLNAGQTMSKQTSLEGMDEVVVTTKRRSCEVRRNLAICVIKLTITITKEPTTGTQKSVDEEQENRKRKLIFFEGNAYVVPWENWHGSVTDANGFECRVCQVDVGKWDLEKHVQGRNHKGNVARPFVTSHPHALLRQVNDATLHCVTCNVLLSSRDSLPQHLSGKRHGRHLDRVLELSGARDAYDNCGADVLWLSD